MLVAAVDAALALLDNQPSPPSTTAPSPRVPLWPTQLPVSASLPTFLVCFHAINLPFSALNAARLAQRTGGKAGAANSAVGATPDRMAAKLATAAKLAVD